MGAWGVHSFENDTAVEWSAAYRQMGLGLAASTVRIALEDHLDRGLDADMSTRALIAAEAVACALGRGHPEAAKLFEGAPQASQADAEALVAECNDLIMAVTGGSELAELWKDASWGEHEKWIASLTDLRSRLNGDAEAPAPVAAEPAEPSLPTTEALLEDLRKAIGGLAYDIEVLRQETQENFARLAKRVEEIGR